MSMMNSGRLRRARIACSTSVRVRMGSAAPVAVMTMSDSRRARRPDRSQGWRCRPSASASARGVRHRPARDEHPPDPLRAHVQRRELAHLARADDEHVAPLQIAEDLARQRDRRVADRDGARGERRLRAHALADGERRVEQPVEQRAGRAALGGQAVARPSPVRGSAARRPRANRGRPRRGTGGGPRRGRPCRRRAARAPRCGTPWKSETNASSSRLVSSASSQAT